MFYFCSKIFDVTANYIDKSVRGGNFAVDTIDNLCLKWLRTRECDRNFEGGACHQMRLENIFYDSSDCGSLSEDCQRNSCLIDEYYTEVVDGV